MAITEINSLFVVAIFAQGKMESDVTFNSADVANDNFQVVDRSSPF